MTSKAKAKSPIFEAVHETACDIHRLGFIDKRNMHTFDALCLAPVPDYDSGKIRALRDHLQLSRRCWQPCSTRVCPRFENGKAAKSTRVARR